MSVQLYVTEVDTLLKYLQFHWNLLSVIYTYYLISKYNYIRQSIRHYTTLGIKVDVYHQNGVTDATRPMLVLSISIGHRPNTRLSVEP